MIILGVDSSSKQSSVCIMSDGRVIFTAVQATNTTHSQNLMPMIDDALKVCSLTPKDIDLYAVTVGPGSFTGLRIGMAAVKGMASARNTPCIGVSSLQALARSVDFEGIVVPAFDARRNQVYACAMDKDKVLLDDFCRDVSRLEEFIKNSEKDIFFVGDGSTLCYNVYNNYKNVKASSAKMPCIAMGACLMAVEEYEKNGAKTHFDLSPSYLRLSQAERELREKKEGKK